MCGIEGMYMYKGIVRYSKSYKCPCLLKEKKNPLILDIISNSRFKIFSGFCQIQILDLLNLFKQDIWILITQVQILLLKRTI